MKYFIYELKWSQTDHDTVIVQAHSRNEAEQWLKRYGGRGPRYVEYRGEVDKILQVG